MCGIAGFVGRVPDAQQVAGAMAARIVHRGPDEGGVYLNDDVALAIRRLAIVDVAHGRQPYANEDGSVHAVFNGEIYAFRTLRRRLERLGHAFRSDADGEVIVHAYEEYGDQLVDHIDGMFAFAVWDARSRRLLLARDRAGKKPLAIARHADGGLTFASEMSALFEDPRLSPRLDPEGLSQYLALGYVPAPHSAFQGVAHLPPAALATWQDGIFEQRRYWRLAYEPKLDISYPEALEELDRLAGVAVRRRLLGDVPLGAFLSGGIDSSYVVSHMVQAAPGRVRTFAIGFGDGAYDERRPAARVAAHLGTDHHEEAVTASDLPDLLPRLVRGFGEPFGDSSAVPTFYLARMARREITVALSGDGGDELLGGYERHVAARVANRFDRLPMRMRRGLHGISASALLASGDGKSRRQKSARFLSTLALEPDIRYTRWGSVLAAGDGAGVLDRVPRLGPPPDAPHARGALDRALAADFARYLPGDLLVKVDIATMAASLEARAPLLDRELLEFCARLPAGYKQRGLTTKRLLRDALARRVPKELWDRPKMGFAAPVHAWLREELQPLLTDCLLGSSSHVHRFVDSRAMERAVRDHLARRSDNSRLLWGLLMLDLWFREWSPSG